PPLLFSTPTPPPDFYTLSLHDALPISTLRSYAFLVVAGVFFAATVLLHELDARIRLSPLAGPGLAGTLLLSVAGGTTIASGSISDGGAVLAVGLALALRGGFEQRLMRRRDVATVQWV